MPPIAVVTGGGRGIGLEVCRQLAARNWTVGLGGRSEERARRAAGALAAEGLDVRACVLDVTDPGSVRAAAAWARAELGGCDVLVNNAAIHYDLGERAGSEDLRIAREALETNVLGAWACAQAFLPLLRRSGHGRIVNVSSEAGSLSRMGAGAPAYQVSKAALNALTRTLAAELRRDGILVNAICPGWTATDMGGGGGRPVADGAASVVWGALLEDGGPSGGFFRDGRPLAW
jgi:NAD(P)-dependent dehydrogenase (short-subunit alcohol dehydrogenase family)